MVFKTIIRRFAVLVITALIGYYFFTNIIDLIYRLNNDVQLNERLAANIQMLVLSVPTLIALWVFRTNDTKEQIEKTQTNINISILSKGIDLLHNKEGKSESRDLKKSSLGLVLLIKLKQDHPILAKQIDMATRNTELNSTDLRGADLRGANLQGANLAEADLLGAQYNDATQFPDGFTNPEKHGMVKSP